MAAAIAEQSLPGLVVLRFAGIPPFTGCRTFSWMRRGISTLSLSASPGMAEQPIGRDLATPHARCATNPRWCGRCNRPSLIRPYDLANVADLGDCPVNPANVDDALKGIETYFKKLVKSGIRPLSAGGDHLCSLPDGGKRRKAAQTMRAISTTIKPSRASRAQRRTNPRRRHSETRVGAEKSVHRESLSQVQKSRGAQSALGAPSISQPFKQMRSPFQKK